MSEDMQTDTCLGLSAGGFHRIRYAQWGDPDNPRVVFCVHGLTRNGRDFDYLARSLSRHFRVICPDVVGRGGSDWLTDKSAYQYPQYLADMAVLIGRSGAERVDWVGTSMGGLIGMLLAAQPRSPIRRLVINDVGPFIPLPALKRIGEYVGSNPRFPDIETAERFLRTVSAPFGPLTDAQWRHLAIHGVVEREDGYALAYDPGIRAAFEALDADVDLWPVWGSVGQPALILRGVDSDVLTRDSARRMIEREAPTSLVEFDGVGHAPMLMDDGQIAVVEQWLLGNS